MSNADAKAHSQGLDSGKPDRLQVQAVVRAFSLLEVFTGPPQSYSLAQLAAAAGMDKSNAQRLVHTLTGLGYLARDEDRLRPGARLLERAADYLRWDGLAQSALPLLTELNRQGEEAVDLSRFDRGSMLYMLRLQSRRGGYHAQLVGVRVPVYCTSTGRAVMSRLPDSEAMSIVKAEIREARTPHTITTLAGVGEKIREARRIGYALTVQEFRLGEIAIAAPIMDAQGRPVATVRVAASLSDWSEEDFTRRFAPAVTECAAAIESFLR